jgi:hypothetical protein
MTNRTTNQSQQRRDPLPLFASIGAGLAAFSLLMAAGFAYSRSVVPEWSARANVLVLPGQPVNPDQVPAYYETLSRGQMVHTLAELSRLGEFQTETADRYGFTEAQREAVELTVIVVANSAMLQVVATSEDPNLAVAMVDGVVDLSTQYVADLSLPYALVPVGEGRNNVTESGLPQSLVILVFGLVALGLGVAYQQAIYRLVWFAKRRQGRRLRTSKMDRLVDDDADWIAEAPYPEED